MKKLLVIAGLLFSLASQAQVGELFGGTANVFAVDDNTGPQFIFRAFFNEAASRWTGDSTQVGDHVFVFSGNKVYRLTVDSILAESAALVTLRVRDSTATLASFPTGVCALMRLTDNNLYPATIPGLPNVLYSKILTYFAEQAELAVGGSGTGVTTGVKGDINVVGADTDWQIMPDSVTNASLANMPAGTIKANLTGGSANPTDATYAQIKAALGANEYCRDTITQTAHGFSKAEAIYYDGTEYVSMIGLYGDSQEPHFLVIDSTTVNTFVVAACGIVNDTFGLVEGLYYSTDTGLSVTPDTVEYPIVKVFDGKTIVMSLPGFEFDATGQPLIDFVTVTGQRTVLGGGVAPTMPDSIPFVDTIGVTPYTSLGGIIRGLIATLSFTSGSVIFAGTDGTPTQDNSTFFWNNILKNLGIDTNSPTNDLSFGNGADRKIWVENTGASTAGKSLTVASGSTVSGTNIAGGSLIFQGGLGTGTGSSSILFQNGTTLGTGTTLQTMSTKAILLGSGHFGVGTTPTARLTTKGSSISASDFSFLAMNLDSTRYLRFSNSGVLTAWSSADASFPYLQLTPGGVNAGKINIGQGSQTGNGSIAIGNSSGATGVGSIAIGQETGAGNGNIQTSVGVYVQSSNSIAGSVGFGNYLTRTQAYSGVYGIGRASTNLLSNTVGFSIGLGIWSDIPTFMIMGHAGNTNHLWTRSGDTITTNVSHSAIALMGIGLANTAGTTYEYRSVVEIISATRFRISSTTTQTSGSAIAYPASELSYITDAATISRKFWSVSNQGKIRNYNYGDGFFTGTIGTLAAHDTDGNVIEPTLAEVKTYIGHISNTATLDYGSIASLATETLTITVTGAVIGDVVSIGIDNASKTTGLIFGQPWVSATNTVSIEAYNSTLSPIDPASGTFKATVIK